MSVYVHLAEGFEEIEAITIIDVLRRASIPVTTISMTGHLSVRGAHDIHVSADKLYEDIDYLAGQMIVLPGGMPGTRHLESHKGLANQITEYKESNKWICAICAAPLVLGKLNILNGKSATCYPGFEKELLNAKVSNERVVQDGKIITSKGPGTAIEFSLKIVENLKGKDLAEDLKNSMIL